MYKKYYVYILSNARRTVLYIGVTNELSRRIEEHKNETRYQGFCGRYNVFELVYYEEFGDIEEAILKEKKLKGFGRAKKELGIDTLNPERLTLAMF